MNWNVVEERRATVASKTTESFQSHHNVEVKNDIDIIGNPITPAIHYLPTLSVRHFPASTTSVDQRKIVDDVICVGWDGHPLVDGPDKSDGSRDRGDTNTRLFEKTTHPTEAGDVVPFSPAMAGSYVTSDAGDQGIGFQTSYYGGGTVGGIVKYKEEDKVDGVDEAMNLAEKLFQERRERGDPDSPQANILAKMGRRVCS